MPQFECPHCGTSTEIDGRYAGQTGKCVSCARTITVPDEVTAPAPKTSSTTPAWLRYGVVAAICSFLVLATVGVVQWAVRPMLAQSIETAKANQARERARQLVAAIYAYEADNGTLPPAYSVDENGKPLHSWRVLILPYMGADANSIYQNIRLEEPWDSPRNSAYSALALFQSPEDRSFGVGDTSFCLVTDSEFAFHKSGTKKLEDLKDEQSTMLMVIEVRASGINWMEPKDVDLRQLLQGINAGGKAICGSFRREGSAACGFANGDARLVSDVTPPDVLQEMATIDGGELPEPTFDD